MSRNEAIDQSDRTVECSERRVERPECPVESTFWTLERPEHPLERQHSGIAEDNEAFAFPDRAAAGQECLFDRQESRPEVQECLISGQLELIDLFDRPKLLFDCPILGFDRTLRAFDLPKGEIDSMRGPFDSTSLLAEKCSLRFESEMGPFDPRHRSIETMILPFDRSLLSFDNTTPRSPQRSLTSTESRETSAACWPPDVGKEKSGT